MQREILECGGLHTAFGLSRAARTSQRTPMETAYKLAVVARGEVPPIERLESDYTPIASRLTACGGHAGRDFKLIVGTALLTLLAAEGVRLTLDIIGVKTRHGDGDSYCVIVTEAGAERIMAVARSMTFEAAEQARASKPKGAEADAAKHALDALAELGLTNVLGLALPDTRNLTPEQLCVVLAVTWAIRQATVSGGDGLWAAINNLALAAPPALAEPPLAAGTPQPQPQSQPARIEGPPRQRQRRAERGGPQASQERRGDRR